MLSGSRSTTRLCLIVSSFTGLRLTAQSPLAADTDKGETSNKLININTTQTTKFQKLR